MSAIGMPTNKRKQPQTTPQRRSVKSPVPMPPNFLKLSNNYPNTSAPLVILPESKAKRVKTMGLELLNLIPQYPVIDNSALVEMSVQKSEYFSGDDELLDNDAIFSPEFKSPPQMRNNEEKTSDILARFTPNKTDLRSDLTESPLNGMLNVANLQSSLLNDMISNEEAHAVSFDVAINNKIHAKVPGNPDLKPDFQEIDANSTENITNDDATYVSNTIPNTYPQAATSESLFDDMPTVDVSETSILKINFSKNVPNPPPNDVNLDTANASSTTPDAQLHDTASARLSADVPMAVPAITFPMSPSSDCDDVIMTVNASAESVMPVFATQDSQDQGKDDAYDDLPTITYKTELSSGVGESKDNNTYASFPTLRSTFAPNYAAIREKNLSKRSSTSVPSKKTVSKIGSTNTETVPPRSAPRVPPTTATSMSATSPAVLPTTATPMSATSPATQPPARLWGDEEDTGKVPQYPSEYLAGSESFVRPSPSALRDVNETTLLTDLTWLQLSLLLSSSTTSQITMPPVEFRAGITKCFIQAMSNVIDCFTPERSSSTDKSHHLLRWKKFLLLPHLLLCFRFDGSSVSRKVKLGRILQENINKILANNWDFLAFDEIARLTVKADYIQDTATKASQAIGKVKEGLMSKAMSALVDSNIITIENSINRDYLESLYPQHSLTEAEIKMMKDTNTLLGECSTPEISYEEMMKTLKSLAPGGSPGMLKLRKEHIISMLTDFAEGSFFGDCLLRLLNHLLLRENDCTIFHFFGSGNLVTLMKDDLDKTKIRPIGIGDIISKLTLGALTNREEHTLTSIGLDNAQVALGVANGREKIIGALNYLLEARPMDDIISMDSKNAFNCISKHQALYGGASFVPSMTKFAAKLMDNNPLFFYKVKGATTTTCVEMQTGVTQGSVASSILYGLGTLPLLSSMREHTGVNDVFAYSDDITVHGSTPGGIEALKTYDKMACDIGIALNYSKTVVMLGRKGSREAALQARDAYRKAFPHLKRILMHPKDGGPAINYGIKLLGAYIGSDEYIQQEILLYIDQVKKKFNALGSVKNKHARLLMLQNSAQAWIVSLLRLLHPRFTAHLCAEIDRITKIHLSLIADVRMDDIKDMSWKVATISRKQGGIGMTNNKRTAISAYLAGSAAAIQFLEERGWTGDLLLFNTWYKAVKQVYRVYSKDLQHKDSFYGTSFQTWIQNVDADDKLQKRLMKAGTRSHVSWIKKHLLTSPASASQDSCDLVSYRSHLMSPEASLALLTPGRDLYSDSATTLILREMLVCTPSDTLADITCPCGKKLTHGYNHLHSCRSCSLHDDHDSRVAVMDVFSSLARETGTAISTISRPTVTVNGRVLHSIGQAAFEGSNSSSKDVYVDYMPLVNLSQFHRPRASLDLLSKTMTAAASIKNKTIFVVSHCGTWSSAVEECLHSLLEPILIAGVDSLNSWRRRLNFAIVSSSVLRYQKEIARIRLRVL
jgi:hypothetical protein